MVRAWFNAPMSDYQVVFTKSATDSLKLVGETFPWTKKSMFRYGCHLCVVCVCMGCWYVCCVCFHRVL